MRPDLLSPNLELLNREMRRPRPHLENRTIPRRIALCAVYRLDAYATSDVRRLFLVFLFLHGGGAFPGRRCREDGSPGRAFRPSPDLDWPAARRMRRRRSALERQPLSSPRVRPFLVPSSAASLPPRLRGRSCAAVLGRGSSRALAPTLRRACSRPASSSAVLPIPGSPRMTSVPAPTVPRFREKEGQTFELGVAPNEPDLGLHVPPFVTYVT